MMLLRARGPLARPCGRNYSRPEVLCCKALPDANKRGNRKQRKQEEFPGLVDQFQGSDDEYLVQPEEDEQPAVQLAPPHTTSARGSAMEGSLSEEELIDLQRILALGPRAINSDGEEIYEEIDGEGVPEVRVSQGSSLFCCGA